LEEALDMSRDRLLMMMMLITVHGERKFYHRTACHRAGEISAAYLPTILPSRRHSSYVKQSVYYKSPGPVRRVTFKEIRGLGMWLGTVRRLTYTQIFCSTFAN
jgi:hypothetical protein